MLARVNWAQPNSDGHPMYNVFEMKEYFAETLTPRQVRLMLDGDKHDIVLSNGDIAYIMNNEGKTVDVVRT